MRYQAPEHVSEVFTASGPRRADENGVIELEADAPDHEHASMRAAGCIAIPDEPAAKGKAPKVEEPPEDEQPAS